MIAGTCFDDDFFTFVGLYGDAAVDEPCLYERGTRGIAERHGDTIGARCVCVDACSSARACICDALSAKPAKATAAAKMYGKLRVWLFMVFEDTDVSIQIFNLNFRAAGADVGGSETVGVERRLFRRGVLPDGVQRHSGHREIAVNAAVEGLEAEIGGEAAAKKKSMLPLTD